MKNLYYKLDGKEPVECSLWEWGELMRDDHDARRVDSTHVGDVHVSTVFLGMDHSFGADGPPILFETMIFGGEHDQYQVRYATWDEAVEGHARAVKLVEDE